MPGKQPQRSSRNEQAKDVCEKEVSGAYRPADAFVLRKPDAKIEGEFALYYKRAASGELSALVDYFRNYDWCEPDLGSAFYECLGYLAVSPISKHRDLVRNLMRLRERRKQQPLEQEGNRAEYNRLISLYRDHAAQVRRWIKIARNDGTLSRKQLTRDSLWTHFQNAVRMAEEWTNRFRKLEKKNSLNCYVEAQSTADAQLQGRSEMEQFPGRKSSRSLGELYLYYEKDASVATPRLTRELFCRAATTGAKMPEELFLSLATSSPKTVPVSVALRKFAAKKAGIAEGLASRKNHAQENG